MNSAKVYILGAGPGAPDLMTIRAKEVLERAEVVLFDRLVNPQILEFTRPDALLIDVGKRLKQSSAARQNTIHRLMIEHASRNRVVVRLKGGDPFVFGRGGEEIAALAEQGIAAEVVPGISSAMAVPASVGIPVTMRGMAASFGVFAGHPAEDRTDDGIDWDCAARIGTAVFLMGVGRLKYIVARLLEHGRARETPIALIERGTLPDEKVVIGTLGDILKRAGDISPPATIVVGDVVGQSNRQPNKVESELVRSPQLALSTTSPTVTHAGPWSETPVEDRQYTTQGVS